MDQTTIQFDVWGIITILCAVCFSQYAVGNAKGRSKEDVTILEKFVEETDYTDVEIMSAFIQIGRCMPQR